MNEAKQPLTVALLAIPEITASTLYGMYDIFAGVGRDWELVVTGSPGAPRMRPLAVASQSQGFCVANGVWIKPDVGLTDCPAPDLICVPEVFVAPEDRLAGRYQAEIDWVRDGYAAGATLATACSGALLLEEAKQLLETGDLPVEAVANEVGYEDASFFGRLFRRKVGLTPAQYRKRFRGLRQALETGAMRCA